MRVVTIDRLHLRFIEVSLSIRLNRSHLMEVRLIPSDSFNLRVLDVFVYLFICSNIPIKWIIILSTWWLDLRFCELALDSVDLRRNRSEYRLIIL